MALVERAYPTDLSTQADFTAHKVLIEAGYFDQVNAPLLVRDGVIPQGVVLQIGSTVYEGTSDTAITGTASDYVKITPDGATAAAEYVSAVTLSAEASWNSQYNGYYNAGATSLYIFDEGKALAASVVSTILTRYVSQQATGDVAIGRDLAVERNETVGGTLAVGGEIASIASIQVNKDGITNGLGIYTGDGTSVRIYRDDNVMHISRGSASAIEIPANRNVGIGKTPTTKLDVDGDITAVGDFRKSGQTGGVAGQNASATSGGAVGQNASATSGFAAGINAEATLGGTVGDSAKTTNGGAVGYNASAIAANAGGAVGNNASTTTGFAGGTNTSSTTGGAVGQVASATTGGAVGQSASATTGFAGGANASSTTGAAVGKAASETLGGGAVGDDASATTGAAVGNDASETLGGGAVGAGTSVTNGGAVGQVAQATTGFAGGFGAVATNGVAIGAAAVANGTNRNAIGAGSECLTNNEIRLGAPGTTVKLGDGTTVTSDIRDKTDIEDAQLGLGLLKKIRVRRFHGNPRALYYERENGRLVIEDDRPKYDAEEHKKAALKGRRWKHGFIAQEVLAAVDSNEFAAVKHTLVNYPNSYDEMTIDYGQFIPVIVKAIQELSKEVDRLKGVK